MTYLRDWRLLSNGWKAYFAFMFGFIVTQIVTIVVTGQNPWWLLVWAVIGAVNIRTYRVGIRLARSRRDAAQLAEEFQRRIDEILHRYSGTLRNDKTVTGEVIE